MSDKCDNVLPECHVTFDGIGRDLKDIKSSIQKLFWWILGVMTMIAGGAIAIVITTKLNGS